MADDATVPAARLWRASAVLMWVIAAGFGLPAVPVAVYLLRHGELPWFFGLFPMYGGPIDALVSRTGYALLILLFGVVAIAETAVGCSSGGASAPELPSPSPSYRSRSRSGRPSRCPSHPSGRPFA